MEKKFFWVRILPVFIALVSLYFIYPQDSFKGQANAQNTQSASAELSEETEEVYITVKAQGGGSIIPSTKIRAKKGESVTITFAPHEKYRLPFDISDNGKTVFFTKSWDGKYTLENLSENHVIEIMFIPLTSVLTPSIEDTNNTAEASGISPFTVIMCVIILIFASVAGAISIVYSNRKTYQGRKV